MNYVEKTNFLFWTYECIHLKRVNDSLIDQDEFICFKRPNTTRKI